MILGNPKRQINDRLDQSIQVTNKVLLVMADNRHIIVAGFWDKSFRIYSTDNAKLEQGMYHKKSLLSSRFEHGILDINRYHGIL